MGLLGALYNSMSGLTGYSSALDNLSTNVANVNTPGYKSSSQQFRDVLEQGSLDGEVNNPSGAGVEVTGKNLDLSQGQLQTSNSDTDLAINGNGFFVLRDGNDIYFTRGGQFKFDEKGVLIETSTGYHVASLSNGSLNDIDVDALRTNSAKATTSLSLSGALKLNANSGDKFPSDSDAPVKITVFDAEGREATVSLKFTKSDGNKWIVDFLDANGAAIAPSHVIEFTALGSILYDTQSYSLSYQPFKLIDQQDLHQNFTAQSSAKFENGVNAESSNLALDLKDAAIITRQDGTVTLSKNEQYKFDAQGYLIDSNSALRVAARSDTGVLSDFYVGDSKNVAAVATTKVRLSGKLDANTANTDSYPPASADPISFNIVDAAGNNAVVTGRFVRDSSEKWSFVANNSEGTNLTVAGSLFFDTSGILAQGSSSLQLTYTASGVPSSTITIDLTNTSGASSISAVTDGSQSAVLTAEDGKVAGTISEVSFDQDGKATLTYTNGDKKAGKQLAVARESGAKVDNVKIDFSKITASNNATNQISVANSDGYSIGQISSLTFDSKGILKIKYSNGQSVDGPQVALASFGDPTALISRGKSIYTVDQHNKVTYGVPDKDGQGVIEAKKLELANVEISDQFADIIIVQRGYQASSQVLRVTSELIEELYNTIRGR